MGLDKQMMSNVRVCVYIATWSIGFPKTKASFYDFCGNNTFIKKIEVRDAMWQHFKVSTY